MTSARARLGTVLARWSGRPTLFAVAVMNVITGLGLGVGISSTTFGGDASLYRHCASLLSEGQTQFCGFLYSPLMAVAARPLTWFSPSVAILAMSLISLGILLVGIARETRGEETVDRVLTALAVVTYAPVVYELLLGQTTVLIAAALYPVVRRPDALRNGVFFGVALALAPKPLLVPVLVWMIVWRRRSLVATVLTASALTLIGVALLGVQQYADWIRVLAGAGTSSMAGSFVLQLRDMGNSSLWPLTPLTVAVAGLVVVVAAWTIVTDSSRGLVASLLAGLLLAPYTMLYAYTILLLGVRPALLFSPRATRVLALTANISRSPATLTIWSVGALVACLPFDRIRAPRIGSRDADEKPPGSTDRGAGVTAISEG